MKKTISLVAIAAILASCSSPKGEKANTGDAVDIGGKDTKAIIYSVALDKSSIEWTGTKPLGQHVGTIAIKSGEVGVSNGIITSGTFIIDMKTIKCLDITDKAMNEKLVGHLKSPDFFDVEKYPEAKFEIQKSEYSTTDANYMITGNLALKDVTKSISFKANIELLDNKLTALTPTFVIDRTSWNVKYGSKKFFDNLKDQFINDDIALKINLEADKK